jgi:ubiquinone/menaquinone biosynthesis C-methylase UbiE
LTLQLDPEATETRYLHDLVHLAGKHVVEIGCGDGRLTWRYARTARRVAGVDLDPARLQTARSDCPRDLRAKAAFALADSLALPFPQETFDVALLAWSL